MIDVPFKNSSYQLLLDVSNWLEINMPNPPLPEEQRWTIGFDPNRGIYGISFNNEHDATIFALRWA